MMYTPSGLRIATTAMALVLGSFAIDTILAEAMGPGPQRFPQDITPPGEISSGSLAEWTATAALRGDLVANLASARAVSASRGGKAQDTPDAAARDGALATARLSLTFAPHSSAMWLLAAMLQSRMQTGTSSASALKMSYLTAANDMSLIPTRLAIVSRSPALVDGELRDLARGDIRLILTRGPEQKIAIINAYRGASSDGKVYIEDVVRSFDPHFSTALR